MTEERLRQIIREELMRFFAGDDEEIPPLPSASATSGPVRHPPLGVTAGGTVLPRPTVLVPVSPREGKIDPRAYSLEE